MSDKNLIIVESPSKAKTIEKILGSKYHVLASKGHIRDLPKSRMGIDIENNFEPEYINVRGQGDVIKEIKKAAKDSKCVYLATDPDREGEAIAWHISSILGLDENKANRIEFYEITKDAVKKAVTSPRTIDMKLVDAQQGRRVTDRIVGYGISPVLWKKVARGLSAGRVQSPALKIICDREDEIESFIPKKYFAISASLSKLETKSKKSCFVAKLDKINGQKIVIPNETHEATIFSKEIADKIVSDLQNEKYVITDLENKETYSKAFAPFTTSTLQQDASSKLGFAPKKTMMLAQQLYEGINIKGKGSVGLITYMRTDSVRISSEADKLCKEYIKNTYGEEYIGNNFFANKGSNTQDAHEAIRPTNIDFDPEALHDSLNSDQYKLYKLIWSRFVASRMSNARFDSVSCDITAGKYTFKANGRTLKFNGYLSVYGKSSDDKDKALPPLEKGEELNLLELLCEDKETEAPSRFSEATLIKELEELGIGRPSTYAPIVSNLVEKRYITKEKKMLYATDLGRKIIREIMDVYFKDVVDINFTSKMEENLDKIAEGELKWKDVVKEYYDALADEIETAKKEADKIEIKPEFLDEVCPKCKSKLVLRHGKNGDFKGCSAYPKCDYTASIIENIGIKCPSCDGDLIRRRGKKGKVFYGCSNYPKCDQVFWYKPVDEKCPLCGRLLVQRGKNLRCSNDKCEYIK